MTPALLADRVYGGWTMGHDPDFHDWPDKRPDGSRAKGATTPPVALWSWVYIANLPIPAYFGTLLSLGLGLLGLVAGVALLHEAGRRACYRYPWAVRTVSYGGVVVAVAQFFPGFHMLAGLAGVSAAGAIVRWDASIGLALGPATALLATVFTGLILIACAGAMGLIGRAGCYIAASLKISVRGRRSEP